MSVVEPFNKASSGGVLVKSPYFMCQNDNHAKSVLISGITPIIVLADPRAFRPSL
jgi:hypothetical protein